MQRLLEEKSGLWDQPCFKFADGRKTTLIEYLGFFENLASKLIAYQKYSEDSNPFNIPEEQAETKAEDHEASANPYASELTTNKIESSKHKHYEDFDLEVRRTDFSKTNENLLDLVKFRKRNKDIFDDETQASFGYSRPKTVSKGALSAEKHCRGKASKTPGATQTGFELSLNSKYKFAPA
jgi:hypothetical protein